MSAMQRAWRTRATRSRSGCALANTLLIVVICIRSPKWSQSQVCSPLGWRLGLAASLWLRRSCLLLLAPPGRELLPCPTQHTPSGRAIHCSCSCWRTGCGATCQRQRPAALGTAASICERASVRLCQRPLAHWIALRCCSALALCSRLQTEVSRQLLPFSYCLHVPLLQLPFLRSHCSRAIAPPCASSRAGGSLLSRDRLQIPCRCFV